MSCVSPNKYEHSWVLMYVCMHACMHACMSTVSSCAFLVLSWRRNEVMVGVYFRALLRANRGIHQCMLSRRACRASNLWAGEGVSRIGVGVVKKGEGWNRRGLVL